VAAAVNDARQVCFSKVRIMLTAEQVDEFHREGFVVLRALFDARAVATLVDAVERIERAGDNTAAGVSWSDDRVTTIQNIPLQPAPLCLSLQYPALVDAVTQLVGGPIRVTGGLLLDKDPKHNWAIGWHQDNGIYVSRIPQGERDDVRGGLPVYSTQKMELARNVTCRVALDASTPENGGLFVLPGSHLENRWPAKTMAEDFADEPGVGVVQRPGDVLCYAPLLMHRSEKSAATGRRRVIHLQYGPVDLQLPGTECYPFPQPTPVTPVAW
jgi:ectoine hydroxylase-related dioxygenase (phytanoyl-CoA dioxygenase family)